MKRSATIDAQGNPADAVLYVQEGTVRLSVLAGSGKNLVDQLFNNSEKRLARTLLLLARYGKPDGPRHVLPNMSQEVLAEIVGTTRSRVNVFMNKFRKLGFIDRWLAHAEERWYIQIVAAWREHCETIKYCLHQGTLGLSSNAATSSLRLR